jgi:hypothetical protein
MYGVFKYDRGGLMKHYASYRNSAMRTGKWTT